MPPEQHKTEVEKFFETLPSEADQQTADIFAPEGQNDTTSSPAEGSSPEEGTENTEHKNRRHRRWEARLAERERQIELEAARLEGLKMAQTQAMQALASDPSVDSRLVQMYGDNTAAIKLHQELLNDFVKKAKEEAAQELLARQAEEAREQKQLESFIDEELESIEDEFGIDITSNAPAARKMRNEFLDMIEKVSPKDTDGRVTDFADFRSTWEMYQAAQAAKKPTTSVRAKEMAGLSMERTGNGTPTPKAPTPGFDGWKKDLGLY